VAEGGTPEGGVKMQRPESREKLCGLGLYLRALASGMIQYAWSPLSFLYTWTTEPPSLW